MTLKICDVCHADGGKKINSRYRTGFRGGMKIDLCVEHKGWGKGKTMQEFNTQAISLLGNASLARI